MASIRSKAVTAAEKITADAMSAALALVTTASETAARLAQTAADTAANLRTHEAVCAERYNGVRDDIKSLRGLILWGGGLAVSAVGILIIALAIVAWAFVKRELKLP